MDIVAERYGKERRPRRWKRKENVMCLEEKERKWKVGKSEKVS